MRHRGSVRVGAAGPVGTAVVSLALLLAPSSAAAQQPDGGPGLRPAIVLGYGGFVDEVTDHHLVLGGALRVPVSSSWALEPELLYMRDAGSPAGNVPLKLVLQANVVRRLGAGDGVVPYVVAGGGLLYLRTEFPGALDETFTTVSGTGGIGLGLEVRLGERLVLGPEVRVGYEPLLRATVALGYEL